MPARPPLILPDVTRLYIGFCPGAYSIKTHLREGESLADDLYHERGIVRSRAASLLRSTEIQPLFVRFVRYLNYISFIISRYQHTILLHIIFLIHFHSLRFRETRAGAYADETLLRHWRTAPRLGHFQIHASALDKPGLEPMRMTLCASHWERRRREGRTCA